MQYRVIYDGNCNLCTSLVRVLENLDRGQNFSYSPMQNTVTLAQWQITPEDCELGMILIDTQSPENRWQGSDAAEEIARILPGGEAAIAAYRNLPGMKDVGDRIYAQVRDRRYDWFGRRSETYICSFDGQCSAPDVPNL
ncbi:thiol-disulfide oxidoreductase DCC family protein [Roseofilum casamattae]|uniref:DCC1-like thiol-disulfide oxidoreductase family protein n=1 Tax=Roseofilum casamattae BLCC-M143 TaxID=3022442 RepID=A0ABT7C1Q0_9CYAN|nr:DCC1-like thiol-disulfide oxidoreductase family protein [Roseofilum casamattae]MDJ1185388.1 DCC1-like thiol-disulfide oxidoreductase family protein [Roseofilum casamattae BLCC-M143]